MPRPPGDISDATLKVLLAPGIGPVTWRRLRAALGDDEAIVRATPTRLARIEGIGATTAASIRRALDEGRPDEERAAMEQAGASLVLQEDDDFPALLAAIPDPPAALWLRGRLSDESHLSVAIVGSRRCTAYGREQAGRLAALLAQSGLAIVSGGALGIDGEAHRGALRVGGATIVVLGCGLGRCYPPEHRALVDRVVEEGGAVVSEYPTMMEPRREHFPRRNRIISGLSLGVIVIEAGRRSGALITARVAADEQGREVMAVPGRIDSPASRGCLELLRDGGAALVTDHVDVLMQLESASHLVEGARAVSGRPEPGPVNLTTLNLSSAQLAILEVVGERQEPMRPEEIAAAVQQPVHAVLAELTLLQVRGLIGRDHRGVRGRTARDA